MSFEIRDVGTLSPGAGGACNRRLLEAARATAPAGMEVELFEDLAAVPLYNADLDEATHRKLGSFLAAFVEWIDLTSSPSISERPPG